MGIKEFLGLEEVKTIKLYVALLAEIVGTMVLVIIGCGSCTNWGKEVGANRTYVADTYSTVTVQISLCFGFSIATIVWIIARISGGHINPAVTLGFLVTRKIGLIRALLYVAGQCLGAIAGAGLLKKIVPVGRLDTLGTSSNHAEVGDWQTFAVEACLTSILLFTVFATCDSRRKDLHGSGPLAIGLAIAMCHLWAVPVTGAGMNPARVLGPALVSSSWSHHWAYWVGPAVGSFLSSFTYEFVFAVNATQMKLRGFFTANYKDEDYDEHGKIGLEFNKNDAELKPQQQRV